MGTKKKYALYRQETVRDIYDDLFYVNEVKAAPQHGLRIYFGRLITQPLGGCRIVLTTELVKFIKETLDWKKKAFNLPFTYSFLGRLRYKIQLNPYNSYKQWLANPKRPTYVTFDQSCSRPEKVEDVDGQKFILYSAEMSALSIPVLRGYEEDVYNNSMARTPKHILTLELSKVITDYREEPEVLLTLMPFKKKALEKLSLHLKPEPIQDVYGASYYVDEVKDVLQHDIRIYFGRLITHPLGGCRIVLTTELLEFIKKTLDWKKEAFNLPFSDAYVNKLRREIKWSPYGSYKQWLADPKRPTCVVFDCNKSLEIIKDIDGQKFILYRAEMSALSIPVLYGYEEHIYNNSSDNGSPKLILTLELGKAVIEGIKKPKRLFSLMPLSTRALKKIRRRLTQEVIRDIHGDLCRVLDIKAVPQHDIDVYFGRFVKEGETGNRIIVTPELMTFVKKTLDWKEGEFNLPFSHTFLNNLRCTLLRSPYSSCKQWLADPKRPTYVTFDQSCSRPEKVEDVDGQKFILYSAEMSALSIPVLRGYEEDVYNNSTSRKPKYILTSELSKVITDYRMDPKLLITLMPFTLSVLDKFRRRLRCYAVSEKNYWFAERLEDLITLAPLEFHKKHLDIGSISPIYKISSEVKMMLAMREKGGKQNAQLFTLLEKNWLTGSTTSKKELYRYCESIGKPISFRRIYTVLKLGHRI